jgi:NAD(P)-dependent dehydrogenase (short-subunit alcohol dehydrogenase family)
VSTTTTKTVFVTGSTTGLGLAAAQMLAAEGHRAVVHARNEARAAEVRTAIDAPVVVGDLATLAGTRAVAGAVQPYGPLDAVIHNAGVYESGGRVDTDDGLERTFQVNVLAPYILTALIPLPSRLIYVSSGMASGGEIVLDDLQRRRRRWSGTGAYGDSKVCLLALMLAIARRYPGNAVTAICPGWVRTRMGGPGAPTDLRTGVATQVYLATSDDPAALQTARFMRHMNEIALPQAATTDANQDGLIEACSRLSGVELPAPRSNVGRA